MDKPVDLATAKIISFTRTLNMKEGYLERKFRIAVSRGIKLLNSMPGGFSVCRNRISE